MRAVKLTLCFLCLLLPVFVTACSGQGSASHVAATTNGVQQLLDPTLAEATAIAGNNEPANAPSSYESQTAGDVDVDLSASGNMAYAELYNMMGSPEAYEGKTVRIHGAFSAVEDPSTGRTIFGCLIQDVTACCAQGLEFEPAGNLSFPSDFPPLDSEITVVGVFATYMENGYQYCTLKNASFTQ